MPQLFFSHTWRPDNLGRNTHERVVEISKYLKIMGWNIWIDENNILNNIDASIAKGIEDSDFILVFLTETYIKKINESAKNPKTRDYCLKEWTYSNHLNKLIVPIVFEPKLLNTESWPNGIVSLQLASSFYINCSDTTALDSAKLINNYIVKLQSNTIQNNFTKQLLKNINNNFTKENINNNFTKENISKYNFINLYQKILLFNKKYILFLSKMKLKKHIKNVSNHSNHSNHSFLRIHY